MAWETPGKFVLDSLHFPGSDGQQYLFRSKKCQSLAFAIGTYCQLALYAEAIGWNGTVGFLDLRASEPNATGLKSSKNQRLRAILGTNIIVDFSVLPISLMQIHMWHEGCYNNSL